MYYFNREDGLRSIPAKTESVEERALLAALCNTFWDTSNLKPADAEQLDIFRRAARHPSKIVWDWAMIGIALKCSYEQEFRELYTELLDDVDIDVRRRMASKVTRLEGDAFHHILPAFVANTDLQVRRSIYRLIERLSTDDLSVVKSWCDAITVWLATETNTENRTYLTFARKRLSSRINRARKSTNVFDWVLIERQLLQAAEETIELVARNHPEVCFRGCLIYCDTANCDITLQLEKCPEGPESASLEEWEYQEFPDFLGAGEPFERLWKPHCQGLNEKMFDSEEPWADPEEPINEFIGMSRRVARQLKISKGLLGLNRAVTFKVAFMTDIDGIGQEV